MMQKALNEKQKQVIELIAEGEKNIVDICKDVQVPRSTYYTWRKNDYFNEKLDEAINEKVSISRQNIRTKFKEYIRILEDISKNGKNENARVNALAKLSTLGELDPSLKQELTVKKDGQEDEKNYLMDLMDKKDEEDGEGKVH
jgi:transposase-like protein